MAVSGQKVVSAYKVIAAGSVNNTLIAPNLSYLRGYQLVNNAAYVVYLHLYDKATAPVCGTDVPILTIAIPASTTTPIPFPLTSTQEAVIFKNGLGFALSKGSADTDATVVVAADIVGTIFYV